MMLSLMKVLRCQDFSGRNSSSEEKRATLKPRNALTHDLFHSLYADSCLLLAVFSPLIFFDFFLLKLLIYLKDLCASSGKKSSSWKAGSLVDRFIVVYV